jgi:hypothetical protein
MIQFKSFELYTISMSAAITKHQQISNTEQLLNTTILFEHTSTPLLMYIIIERTQNIMYDVTATDSQYTGAPGY